MSKKLKYGNVKKRVPWVLGAKEMMLSDHSDGTRIELFSNKELNVEGCRGVMEYTEEFIKLKLKKGSMTVMGKQLSITFFEADSITVKGTLASIEFCV